jgi:hypothetical protein
LLALGCVRKNRTRMNSGDGPGSHSGHWGGLETLLDSRCPDEGRAGSSPAPGATPVSRSPMPFEDDGSFLY